MTPPRDVEELLERMRAGWQPELLLFYGHGLSEGAVGAECLSQWYPAPFELDGVRFATAEHYMMWGKAQLFGDEASARQILTKPQPALAKRIGRKVAGFDEAKWRAHRFDLVTRASVAKFSQNVELGAFLRGTAERVLVEASPRDRIWGIGLAGSDERARDPQQWRGLNLLGFALMQARAQL